MYRLSHFETLKNDSPQMENREMTVSQAKQKRNKNLFIKLWLCYILIYFSSPSHSFSLADDADNIQNSVWKIQHNSGSSGTVFFIKSKLFVTNLHVLQGMLQNEDSFKPTVLQQEGNSSHITINQVVAVSALHDLALVETKESVPSYLNITEETPQPNEKLFVLGYPHKQFKKMKKTGQLIDRGFFYAFPINYSGLSGASGSPVLNEDGQVVGISNQASTNLLIVKKSTHLKNLISGNTGRQCSHFVNLTICIKQEMEDLKKLAEQDFAPAQYRLAKIYHHGEGIKPNPTLAFKWFKKAAESGFVPAQHELSIMYYFGKVTKLDLTSAFYWMQQAAEQGSMHSQYRLAKMYYLGEGTKLDLTSAFYWMKQAAEQGYALAQHELARMYHFGEGTKMNEALAIHWLQKSANLGFAPAQHRLALHNKAIGTKQNTQLAFEWFKKSAEQDYALAQHELAKMYYLGEGTKMNEALAIYWFQKAANLGYLPSIVMLTLISIDRKIITNYSNQLKNIPK